jgi:hypothetical protein
MTKHMYYLGLLLAVWVFVSQPVLAVRLVPGSVPTSTPLQPLPDAVVPNYQGNVNFQASPPTSEVDKPIENPQDEISSDINSKEHSETLPLNTNSNGKWQLVIILALGLALLYGYFRFKKTMR